MPDRNPNDSDATPAEHDSFRECRIDIVQRAMLHAFVDPSRQRPWVYDDIVRTYADISKEGDVEDALGYLKSAGLIYRVDDCYFATRAAVHVYELGILSI
jgi:hypothetical protein